MAVICDRFGIGYDCPAEVKDADNRILRDERDALMKAPPLPWSSIENVPALGVPIGGWEPEYAELRYLDRLVELTGVPHPTPRCTCPPGLFAAAADLVRSDCPIHAKARTRHPGGNPYEYPNA